MLRNLTSKPKPPLRLRPLRRSNTRCAGRECKKADSQDLCWAGSGCARSRRSGQPNFPSGQPDRSSSAGCRGGCRRLAPHGPSWKQRRESGDLQDSNRLSTNVAERERLTSAAAPELRQTIDSNLPLLGQHMRVQGSVILQALVGADGNIENLRVVSGPAILSCGGATSGAPMALQALPAERTTRGNQSQNHRQLLDSSL